MLENKETITEDNYATRTPIKTKYHPNHSSKGINLN